MVTSSLQHQRDNLKDMQVFSHFSSPDQMSFSDQLLSIICLYAKKFDIFKTLPRTIESISTKPDTEHSTVAENRRSRPFRILGLQGEIMEQL